MTNKPSKPAVIQTLLEAGAHFDTLNLEKKAFYNMLKGQPLHEVPAFFFIADFDFSVLAQIRCKEIQIFRGYRFKDNKVFCFLLIVH
jgi:hypothetical protein